MPHTYPGRCHCGNVKFELSLPHSLDAYAPRACDCDFCTSRGLGYLSDPAGKLVLHSQLTLETLTQGSGKAEFLSCTRCRVIVSAVYRFEPGLKGAVNAKLIDEHELLQEPVTVSPKSLEPILKIERWNKLWFPVMLYEGA